MNSALNDLVERRIQEAQRQGQFDDLPGQGRPLTLDDDPLVPEEVRVAHRILKNAGFVPPEVEALRERAGLARLLAESPADADDATVRRARRKLMAMTVALEARGVRLGTQAFGDYRHRLIERLGRDDPDGRGEPPSGREAVARAVAPAGACDPEAAGGFARR